MKLSVIDTGFFKLDGGAMFGVVPKVIWNKYNPADENNLCTWAMRCLLIENKDRLILIDTGIGDKQSEKFFSHYYLHGEASLTGSIKNAGYSPDDITDVFLTHLHFDHVGGATMFNESKTEIINTFPKATYWSNKKHWDWAMNPNPREKASFLKENLLPIKESGKLRFVEDSSPFEEFDILYVDGHTEQQMLPLINYKGQKILYAADLIPSTAHIKLPYIMSFDVQPLKTLKEKELVISQCYENNYLVFFEHDPVVETAVVKKSEKGFYFQSVDFSSYL